MAGKRNLSEEVGSLRSAYFEQEAPPFENEGRREMQPLYPFVISGGRNTERYYFHHISETTDYKFNIVPEYFGMESSYTEFFPERIDKILKTHPDAKVFCVFDWDTIRGRKKQMEKHKGFLDQFKAEIDAGIVVVCPSMPSIEYWFLLHYENHTQLIKTCGRTMQKLLSPYMMPLFPNSDGKQLLKVLKSEEYVKDSGWVEKLSENGKLEAAIQRAENNIEAAEAAGDMENQSYSFVYLLFKN